VPRVAKLPQRGFGARAFARLCSYMVSHLRFPIAGLATTRVEREERGDKIIEIVRVKITEAGRRALQ